MGAAGAFRRNRQVTNAVFVQVQPCSPSAGESHSLASAKYARAELWQAVGRGDCEAVARIIETHGEDPSAVDAPCFSTPQPPGIEGDTPLSLACRRCQVEVARLLLCAEGVDVNRVNTLSDTGGTALTIASESGHAALVQLLLEDKRVDVNVARVDGCTALFMASQNGYTDVVQKLLGICGVDVNKADTTNGFSPLLIAACKGRHAAFLSLLEAAADINTHTPKGYSALIIAIDRHDPVLHAALLMHGADASAVHSALFRACLMGTALGAREALECCRTWGVDENARLSQLHIACILGDEAGVRLAVDKAALGEEAVCRVAGASDASGLGALYYAAELRNTQLAWLIVEAMGVPAQAMVKAVGAMSAQELRGEPRPGDPRSLSSSPGRLRSRPLSGSLSPRSLLREPVGRDGSVFFRAFVVPFIEDRVYVHCEAAKQLLVAYLGSVAAARFFARDPNAFCTLHALSVSGLRTIQQKLEYIYWHEGLAKALGSIGNDAPERDGGGRQDDEDLLPTFPEIYGYGPTATFYEDDYIDALQMLSCALDKAFFEQVEGTLDGIPCVLRRPPIKSRTRMRNKLGDPEDHLGKKRPRPAHNIDTMRCSATFKDPESLAEGYRALVGAFGTPVRVKNSFRSDFDPAKSYGYRSVMLNVRFNTRLTFEDVFGHPDGAGGCEDWDLIAISQVSTETGLAMQRILSEWFRHEAVRTVPIAMAAEVQLILAPYLQARTESHLLYKVARCSGWKDLVSDAASHATSGSATEAAATLRMQDRVARLAELSRQAQEFDFSLDVLDLVSVASEETRGVFVWTGRLSDVTCRSSLGGTLPRMITTADDAS